MSKFPSLSFAVSSLHFLRPLIIFFFFFKKKKKKKKKQDKKTKKQNTPSQPIPPYPSLSLPKKAKKQQKKNTPPIFISFHLFRCAAAFPKGDAFFFFFSLFSNPYIRWLSTRRLSFRCACTRGIIISNFFVFFKNAEKKKRKDVRVTPFSAYCLCYK